MKNYFSKSGIKNLKSIQKPGSMPFKWAGGKGRMMKKYQMRGFFPSDEPEVFVDMFSGSACVAYWVAKNYPNTSIILNEKSEELVNVYRNISGPAFPFFKKGYKRHVNAYASYNTIEDRKKYYYNIRNDYALNYKNKSDMDLAVDLVYLLQTGFNGIWQTSANFNWRYASPAGTQTWKPNGKLFDMKRLEDYSEFMSRCLIVQGDYSALQKYSTGSTWFYADPPYRNSFAKYSSAGEFDENHHTALNQFLISMAASGNTCALSNREDSISQFVPEPDKITKGFFANQFDDSWNCSYFPNIRYTAGRKNTASGSTGIEVLIKNY